jgi:subtilisin family serine protease
MLSRTTTLTATLMLAFLVNGTSAHTAVGSVESWIVLFQNRSFDLDQFRDAIRSGATAERVGQITSAMQQKVKTDQAAFTTALQTVGGKVRDQWWIINGCSVDIPAGTSSQLLLLPGVASIEPDHGASPGGGRAIDAYNHAASTAHIRGYRGTGVGLAIIDSGQDSDTDLSGRPHRVYYPGGDAGNATGGGIGGSRLVHNEQLGRQPADDVTGHGTAVAAAAAGAAWGAVGALDGHAPGATIAGYSIAEGADGTSSTSTIISAWQAVARDRRKFNLVGANNSYCGSPNPDNAAQRALDAAAYYADLLVTVCAYNTGIGGTHSSQSACNGISVGAVTVDDHELTSYSARGPLQGDSERTYPDLCAISSTIGPNPNCELTAGPWFGTSFAAPQVLGAAALVRQAEPELTALETKAILLASTLDIADRNPGAGRNGIGTGLLRDDVALESALRSDRHALVTLGQSGVVTLPIHVQAGVPTAVAITWHRTDVERPDWTDFDVRVFDGGTEVAIGETPRNLYEHVRFVPTRTGTYLVEISTDLLLDGPQEVAMAMAELAQLRTPGAFRSYGRPCAGSGLRPGHVAQGSNAAATSNDLIRDTHQLSATDWVFTFDAPASGLRVTGFEALVALADGPAQLKTSIHLDFGGTPSPLPVTTGVMQVGRQPGWHATTFQTPVDLLPGQRYHVGFRAPATARFQFVLTHGQHLQAFQRWPCGDIFVAAGAAPAGLRILAGTPTPGLEPQMLGRGAPRIGQPFVNELHQALPQTMALLLTGFQRNNAWGMPLPMPLAMAGAPDCTLLCSPDDVRFVVTDPLGRAELATQIPAIPALRGTEFQQQWFVADQAANALGMATTHGATGRIGD